MAANKGHRWRFRLPTDPDDMEDDNELWEQDAPRRSRPSEGRPEPRRRDSRRGEPRRSNDFREGS
jgi:hypothetical protein